MKTFISCVLLTMLTSCGKNDFVAPKLEVWETAPLDHVCTVAQMTKAQNEAGWCAEHTQWRSVHCYGASIIRNCTKRVDNETK
jgi:hypothetical protein